MSLRTILTDNLWKRLAYLLDRTGRVYNKPEHRNTVEGILYRIRTGCPWRDLPPQFGLWNTIYRRFNLWSKKGVWQEVLKSFRQHIDSEWIFIDGSIIKAHQHATGANSQNPQGIGKSVAGNTTKIHLAVDSCGNPIDFILTGGEVHDSKAAADLIALLPESKAIVADRGYDSEELRALILKGLNLQSKCNKKRSTHQLEYNFVSTQKPLPNDEYFLPTSYNKRARKDNDFTRTGQKTSRNCQSTGT